MSTVITSSPQFDHLMGQLLLQLNLAQPPSGRLIDHTFCVRTVLCRHKPFALVGGGGSFGQFGGGSGQAFFRTLQVFLQELDAAVESRNF
jgi:hypothetical protein